MAFAYHTPYADYPALWDVHNQLWHDGQAHLARIDRLKKANARLTAQLLEVKAAYQMIWKEYNHAYEYRKAESAEVERLKKANAQLTAGLAMVNERGVLLAFRKLEKEKLDAVRLADGLKLRVMELEKEKLEAQAVINEMKLDVEKLEKTVEDAETNGLESQTNELEKRKVTMQSNTKWLASYIEELEKDRCESQVATMGLKAQIEDLEREKSEAQEVTSGSKLQVEKLQKMTLDLEAELRRQKLEENNAALAEQLESERLHSEERLDSLNQENLDLRGLDLEIKNYQSESGVKESEERYAHKKMEVEKMKAENHELGKKLENLEGEEKRLSMANEILCSNIYDLSKALDLQMEYKDNQITSLEKTIESLRSQILKIKDCSNAELGDSNKKLEALEGCLEVAVLMLQATFERMKTGKSVEEDKIAEDILDSLSREVINEKAVSFVEGLQAIEEVFRSKEEKIRELEKELLLFNEDWLVVKEQLPI